MAADDNLPRPNLVVAADWSKNDDKRWMTRAVRQTDKSYVVFPPEPVGAIDTLVERLTTQAGDGGTVLLGFDFPIGLPVKYAAKAELSTFKHGLRKFGTVHWAVFYEVSDSPSIRQPFAPLPKKKGEKGYNRTRVAKALGFERSNDLLRRCDRGTNERRSAELLFFTLGGQQVGQSAINGWCHVIAPALDGLAIWPFDGNLNGLLATCPFVIAEIYPGESYRHLDVTIGAGTGLSKTRRAHRRAACRHLEERFMDGEIRLCDAAQSWLRWGFAEEDDFDSMIGVLSMLLLITGARPHVEPTCGEVRSLEGWILGQSWMDTSINASEVDFTGEGP